MDKYQEALDRAKQMLHGSDDSQSNTKELLEFIFPELQENKNETMRERIIRHLNNARANVSPGSQLDTELCDAIKWLEEQKPVEWDNKKMDWICSCLKDYPRLAKFKDECFKEFPEYADWLKSFKPQPRWKPSEEQLLSLKFIINNYPDYVYNADLESLFEYLKNL